MGKLKVRLQQAQQDCLLACYSMLLSSYRTDVAVHELYDEQMLPADGLSASYLRTLDARFQTSTRVYRTPGFSAQQILSAAGRPVILHWRGNHFVVLTNASRKWVTIVDPAYGLTKITHEVFAQLYSEVFMTMESKPVDIPEKHKRPTSQTRLAKIFLSRHLGFLVLALVLGQGVSLLLASGIRQILAGENLVPVSLAVLTSVAVGQVLVHIIRFRAQVRINGHFEDTYSENVFRGLLAQPFLYFKGHTPGSLLERLNLRSVLRDTVLTGAIPSLINFLSVLVLVMYLGWISLPLTAVAVVLSAFFGLAGALNTRSQSTANMNYVQEQVAFSSSTQEDISTIDETKALRTEAEVADRWIVGNHRLRSGFNRLLRVNALTSFIQQSYSAISLVTVAAVGIWLYSRGSIGIPDVVVFQAGVGMLVAATSDLQNFVISLAKARVYEERQRDLVRARPHSTTDDVVLDGHKMIQATNLSYTYPGGRQVFSDLSLDIGRGEKVAIMGDSGTGKSTLMHVLLGLIESKGNVSYGSAQFRDRLGVVLPGMSLHNGTAIDNLVGPNTDPERIQKIWTILSDLNLDEPIRSLPKGLDSALLQGGKNLSTGQAQRMLLARSLIRGSELVFWDEAFSSLDVRNRDQIYNQVFHGDNYADVTFVLISHQLDVLEHVDKVVFLASDNSGAHIGSHSDLLASCPEYREFLSTSELLISDDSIDRR